MRAFAAWLVDQPNHVVVELFTDPHSREHAVWDYRRWLLTDRKAAPKTVDTALTALGHLFSWVGLGRPRRRPSRRPRQVRTKALTADQVREVLRAAERRGPRDHAITAMFIGTGLRISELVALDVDDAWASDRNGVEGQRREPLG